MHYLIPAGLDIMNMFNHLPKELNHEKLLSIIDRILKEPLKIKDAEYLDDFVPLHSSTLRGITQQYRLYLDYLIEHGVLECDELYIPTQKSKGYRMHSRFNKMLAIFKLQENKKHLHCESLAIDKKVSGRNRKKYKHLFKWYEAEGLEIDSSAALDFIEDEYQRKLKDPSLFDKKTQDGTSFKCPLRQRNRAIAGTINILNKEQNASVDDNVRRLWSTLTHLPKQLKNYLSYEGKPLVSIDITNSQPYLASLLFNLGFWLNQDGYYNVQNIKNKRLNYSIHRNIDSILMYLYSHDYNLFFKYTQSVQSGKFYEAFGEQLRLKGINENYSRESLKIITYQVLFSSFNYIKKENKQNINAFKEVFPEVYSIFKLVKAENYNELAILLQYIESDLMLLKVTKRIAREKKHLPIFTIHDSIITLKGEEGYVKQIMEEELEKAIGLKPKIAVEYLHPTNIQFNDGMFYKDYLQANTPPNTNNKTNYMQSINTGNMAQNQALNDVFRGTNMVSSFRI